MHTGDTREAVRKVARTLKVGGQINFWVYGAIPVHIDNEEKCREGLMTLSRFVPYWFLYAWSMMQIRLFRRLPHGVAVGAIRLFSSGFGHFFRVIFRTVMHPDENYRYINNYDGWCNSWAETWTEGELFPTLAESNIVVLGVSKWQTGIWGVKQLGFYR
jgi:hypothetical protein